MADYSNFPFDMYTTDEIAQMLIGSVKVDDTEFLAACREELKKRKVPDRSHEEKQNKT